MKTDTRATFRLTPADVLLIAVLAGSSLAMWFRTTGKFSVPDRAYIYQGNRLYEIVSLRQPGKKELNLGKARITIEVKAGAIRMVDSNCRNKLCVRAGWISRPGQTIICAPNRVVIEIQGKKGGYDAEAY